LKSDPGFSTSDLRYNLPMPRGPQGQKRPADVIGNAVKVMRIATGEEQEDTLNPKAIERGRKGGEIRASNLSPRKRKQIAKKAAKARWK
jgi:hypothetical protein